MQPSKRRLIWTYFVLLLTALAWGLHAWLPPEPRWTLAGNELVCAVLPDGTTFLSHAIDLGRPVAPLKVRDLRTGRILRSYFAPGEALLPLAHADVSRGPVAWVGRSTHGHRVAVRTESDKEGNGAFQIVDVADGTCSMVRIRAV